MAGYWPSSAQQVNDLNGKPIVGAKAFFYHGGTTTPLEVYRNYDLTNPHPNPLTTDGFGRFPSVFFDEADGFYDFRLTTAGGVLLYTAVQIPIIGPSDSGGGSPVAPVDPDGVLQTGDLKARYGTGFHEGWVRGNGRTIGSATSGADERAAADCEALYTFLWNNDSTLVVLGGRGANAAADWSANKPLTLPDFRGRTFVGLDTMGNSAANIIPAATALGWADGEATHKLTTDEMPVHDHGGETGTNSTKVKISGATTNQTSFDISPGNTPVTGSFSQTGTTKFDSDTDARKFPINSQGGGANHNNLQPSKGITIYIRL